MRSCTHTHSHLDYNFQIHRAICNYMQLRHNCIQWLKYKKEVSDPKHFSGPLFVYLSIYNIESKHEVSDPTVEVPDRGSGRYGVTLITACIVAQ